MGIELLVYLAFVAAVIFSLFAQIKVSSTFNRYSRVATRGGYTAEQVARRLLDAEGLHEVRIERTRGHLSDHYDPRTKVLRLSDSTYGNASAAAIGVACHEAGHAIQHAKNYAPLALRSFLVPVTSFASRAWWLLLLLGTVLMSLGAALGTGVMLFSIGLFAFTTLFQFVTLPCEFNASARAMEGMRTMGYFTSDELSGARKVLTAAAMTYVAAALVSVLQLLRLILMFRRNDR